MIQLSARYRLGNIELVDERSGQIYCTIAPATGVTVDGASSAVTVVIPDDATIEGDGTAETPLAVKDAGITAAKLAVDLGATAGPLTVISSITVVNGIVTDLQGS